MARDETHIKSVALAYVGEVPLVSGTEATPAQRAVNLVYDDAIDEEFACGEDWQFAMCRAELTRLADASGDVDPATGFDHQYVIPANVSRIVAMIDEDGDDVEYDYKREVAVVVSGTQETETDVIQTDEDEVFIKYIRRRGTPAQWPAWFARIVSLNIALKICDPLKQDDQKNNQLMRWYLWAFTQAQIANGKDSTVIGSDSRPIDDGNDDVIDAVTRSDGTLIWDRILRST